MSRTPDRSPGVPKREDDGLILGDQASDPVELGEFRLNGNDLKAKDGTGVFNLRQGGGSGDVTSSLSITDNSIVRGDGGGKGVQDTDQFTINDSGYILGVGDDVAIELRSVTGSIKEFKSIGGYTKLGPGSSDVSATYPLVIHGAATGGGLKIQAGEVAGDAALYITDQDASFGSGEPILMVEADQGYIGQGTSTPSYGLDNQLDGTNSKDWNIGYGSLRMAGTDFLQIDRDIVNTKTVTFATEYDSGNSGSSKTIDWNNKQKQKSTLTANCTFTFTAPPGVGNFLLKLKQDGTGSRTVTWPGSVCWPGGNAPTLTTAANAIDIVSFYYDGTNYFGVANYDFK